MWGLSVNLKNEEEFFKNNTLSTYFIQMQELFRFITKRGILLQK